MPSLIRRIYHFYSEGFRSMTVGKTLWIIIMVKLIVIFVFVRILFFSPALSGSDEQKADTVRNALTSGAPEDTNYNNIQP